MISYSSFSRVTLTLLCSLALCLSLELSLSLSLGLAQEASATEPLDLTVCADLPDYQVNLRAEHLKDAQALSRRLSGSKTPITSATSVFKELCAGHERCGERAPISLINNPKDDLDYAIFPHPQGGYWLYQLPIEVSIYSSQVSVISEGPKWVLHQSFEEIGREEVCEESPTGVDDCLTASVTYGVRQADLMINSISGEVSWLISCDHIMNSSVDVDYLKTQVTLSPQGVVRYSGCENPAQLVRFTQAHLSACQGVKRDLKASKKLLSKARKLVRAQQLDEAIKVFTQALTLNPKSPWARSERAYAYQLKGDLKRAQYEFKRALKMSAKPKFTSAIYFNLGVIAERQDQKGRAKRWYKRSVGANPKNKGAQRKLAKLR